jgi:hemin uptake protein HemP
MTLDFSNENNYHLIMCPDDDKPNALRAAMNAAEQGRKPLMRRRVLSSDLFGPANELVIEHAADEYRLRITSQGKLILTK